VSCQKQYSKGTIQKGEEEMSKLWICGQLMGEWNESGSVWAFQGVFSDEAKAAAACRDETYFILPVTLDEELPHELVFSLEAKYPRIEQELPK
jgi:hypothetical protein